MALFSAANFTFFIKKSISFDKSSVPKKYSKNGRIAKNAYKGSM